MKLDRNRSSSLYHQLYEILRARISDGSWISGTKIPTEAELMQEFQVCRVTVRQAVSLLKTDGLVERYQGRGTFVSAPKVEQPLLRLTGFSEDMLGKGFRPGSKRLDQRICSAPPEVSEALELAEGDKVVYLRRLRLADDEPMALTTSYLPMKLCSELLNHDLLDGSLYRFLEERLGYRIAKAVQTLKPVVADAKQAALLGIKRGSPLLLLRGTTYLGDSRPIEYLEILYRGDRYEFQIQPIRQTRSMGR